MRSLRGRRKVVTLIGIVLAMGAIFMLSFGGACDSGDEGSVAARNESKSRDTSYAGQVKQEPAHQAKYPATRKRINFWIDTWLQTPDKLSYVYLISSNGQKIGYYILKGLPTTLCAALTPTYRYDKKADSWFSQPAPGVDGVYYSGGQCTEFYGEDASNGAYLEWSVGNGISQFVSDQPLPLPDVQPIAFATLQNVKP